MLTIFTQNIFSMFSCKPWNLRKFSFHFNNPSYLLSNKTIIHTNVIVKLVRKSQMGIFIPQFQLIWAWQWNLLLLFLALHLLYPPFSNADKVTWWISNPYFSIVFCSINFSGFSIYMHVQALIFIWVFEVIIGERSF